MKRVAIISTGNELIYGSVHESNCFYLSGMLFQRDFKVVLHITVGDEIEELRYALGEAQKKADIAIITGGLGPTDDDYTLEALKSIFNFNTTIYEAGKQRMEFFFNSVGRTVMKNDLKQITVPEGAHIFDNDVGLAAGFCYSVDKKIIIAMPGVPTEMKNMFENRVLPFLLKKYSIGEKLSIVIRTVLMREADVNEKIKELNIDFNKIDWGITTDWGMNTVTFVLKSGYNLSKDEILQESRRVFGDRLLSQKSTNLEMELIDLLRERGMTISTAESCTGGLISKRITDIPGASDVFMGGMITYSNSSKIKQLDVSAESINQFGAVSEEVAKEMAKGIRDNFNSSIGLSVTGVAGPGGGSEGKQVGTVCFGFATPEGIESLKLDIGSDRDRVRFFSSQYALDHVRIYLKKRL
ncbi:MAG: CinA family nicotinamide mononucleotide deamidase-related protein [Spirochaetota bacterium]|nr:CinA family nicotinamide mononucleotide deamidase-related protein [Spirochaetota bacterium]